MSEPVPFKGFLMAGFEGSSQRYRDGRRIDAIGASRHDKFALIDYELLARAGIRTIRDAFRWHLIEKEAGVYDWSSILPMLCAAKQADLAVIWDLCHYGMPEGLDIWSDDFVIRFAAYAAAAAVLVMEQSDHPPCFCPINEISFWAWTGGHWDGFYPHAQGRGAAVKRRLVRASIAAVKAIRNVDPRIRFIQAEPIIHVVSADMGELQVEAARQIHDSQYEAFDMLAGRLDGHLGGSEDLLDIVGVNFYWNNQWAEGRGPLGFGNSAYRPFSQMLADVHRRYRRPILIAETGAEGANGPAWLSYVASEVREALGAGVPVIGICLYPAMDYPGWDDARHCPCGLIEVAPSWMERSLRPDMARRVREEAEIFSR